MLVTGGTRRQLTPAQQTHILSDIQQHQHRFSSQNQLLSPGTKQFGQKISHNILIEPSVQTQLPTETTILQFSRQQSLNNPFIVSSGTPQSQALQGNFRQPNNIRSNEHHPQHHTQMNYVPNFSNQNQLVFPQQPLFERNIHQQQVFQRSIANQQGDANINFKPSQPFPAAPPTSILAPNPNIETNNNFGQSSLQPVQTLQQNVHLHTQFNQNPPIPGPQISQFPNQQVQFGPHQTHQNVQPSNNIPFFGDLRTDDVRYKEFVERQKIIQKHEHFLNRQHEKQQAKVRQLHQEFVQKQRRIKEQSIVNSKQQQPNKYFPPQHNSRLVSPYEIGTFERAVQKFHEAYPTQPTTTPEPATENLITSTTIRAKSSRSNVKGDVSEDELEKLYNQFKQDSDKSARKTKAKPSKGLGRDELLKQLKLALAEQPADLGNQNYTTMDLVLPDGQKVQVIRTTDPNLIQGATPLNADGTILSEVATQQTSQTVRADMNVEQTPFIEQFQDSGILPPGSNFEVIRQSSDGDLQPVASLPAEKKVTFVYLEEQTDGSYKVQGVKSNGDKEAKTKGSEVDTIVNRIKNGEIHLPPSSVRRNVVSTSTTVQSSSPSPSTANTNIPYESSSSTTQYISRGTPPPAFQFVSSVSPYSTLSTDSTEDQENLLTASPSSHYPSSTTPRSLNSRSVYTTRSLSTTYSDNHLSSATHSQPSSAASTISSVVHTQPTSTPIDSNSAQNSEFLNILKNNGLHAMAKYLKQSVNILICSIPWMDF